MIQECTKAATDTPVPARLVIDEFSVERPASTYGTDDGVPEILRWRTDGEELQMLRAGGEDYGRILVRLAVDGQFDIVDAYTYRTSDIEALDRAIVALQEVRERLTVLGHDPSGVCMATGDGGRCKLETGHEAPHKFPVLARQVMEQLERSAS